MLVAYLDVNFALLSPLRLSLGNYKKKQLKKIFVTKTDSFTGFQWGQFSIIGGPLLSAMFCLN